MYMARYLQVRYTRLDPVLSFPHLPPIAAPHNMTYDLICNLAKANVSPSEISKVLPMKFDPTAAKRNFRMWVECLDQVCRLSVPL